MKKRKNTQSSSNRESAAFYLLLLLLLFGAGVNLCLFWRSFNEALKKDNPIATITFKHKTAQRRFLERVVWDRLQQESPVYNGDIIRTAPLSEATLWFSDGNKIELNESTMVQVFINHDGLTEADVSFGAVTVDANEAQIGALVKAKNMRVRADKGSSLHVARLSDESGEEDVSVNLLTGNASVQDENGEPHLVEAGFAAVYSEDGQNAPSFAVTAPSPGAKFLQQDESPVAVDFSWKTADAAERALMLEIASEKDFSDVQMRMQLKGVNSVSVALSGGAWYWRIVSSDTPDEMFGAGKVQIFRTQTPVCIAPAEKYTYSFRSYLPAIRFLWSESDYATSYELEVADNKEFTNPAIVQRTLLPSSIISKLGEGKWYWRVTPYFTLNNTGLALPSDIRSFEITQRSELRALELRQPAAGAFVNASEGVKGTGFSWKPSGDAASYTFRIADNKELHNPKVDVNTQSNYVLVQPHLYGIGKGSWYWAVTQSDGEGGVSPLSEVRDFLAVDGEVIQRTVFPPDGYHIGKAYLNDMRFTWKSNVPFDTKMQIAKDEAFTALLYDTVVNASSYNGVSLGEGTYFWRILSDADGRTLAPAGKRFEVMPPLEAPLCLDPANEGRAVVRQNRPYEFKWSASNGADYYMLRLYAAGSDTPLFERGLLRSSAMRIDMDKLREGAYRWTIQPFSDETDMSTRRTGLLGESYFTIRQLHPAVLRFPEDGAIIDGITAALEPGKAIWYSADKTGRTEFVLRRLTQNGASGDVVMRIRNPERTVTLKPLAAGDYLWTITAFTHDGFDISPVKGRRFRVLPVPLLKASARLSPPSGTVFGVEYLEKTRSAEFSWEPVDGATDYFFVITRHPGHTRAEVVFERNIANGTSVKIEDLAEIDQGDFVYSVEAVRRLNDGSIFQHGKIAEAGVKIDLPDIKTPVLNDSGILYGN